MEFGNLTIIGTSHIARQSIEEINSFFKENKPDIVAIELDRQRYQALTSGKRQKPSLLAIKEVGIFGFIFLFLGHLVQGSLGRMVGVEPGAEMLAAIRQAKKNKLPLALVDQDIQITLKRFSSIPFREKARLVWDLLTGFFSREESIKSIGATKIDLSKVPERELVTKLVAIMRKRYPALHRVLVEERNRHMAMNIAGIMLANPDKKILSVVGAGHEVELMGLVRAYHSHSDKQQKESAKQ